MGTEIPAVTKLYDIILWLIPQVEKFPRDYKFTLGDRIVNNLLDSLELLIEAAYSKEKYHLLRKLNLQLEKLRFLIRLSKDLKVMSIKKYAYIPGEINELGKMTGGWIKTESGKNIQKPLE
ncbi:MAG: diversity-generating retroelement protein Avd [Nitrospirae bacterium]|nr:diversity-generating retroelement protein Avd [Nitrospirota bacterium]